MPRESTMVPAAAPAIAHAAPPPMPAPFVDRLREVSEFASSVCDRVSRMRETHARAVELMDDCLSFYGLRARRLLDTQDKVPYRAGPRIEDWELSLLRERLGHSPRWDELKKKGSTDLEIIETLRSVCKWGAYPNDAPEDGVFAWCGETYKAGKYEPNPKETCFAIGTGKPAGPGAGWAYSIKPIILVEWRGAELVKKIRELLGIGQPTKPAPARKKSAPTKATSKAAAAAKASPAPNLAAIKKAADQKAAHRAAQKRERRAAAKAEGIKAAADKKPRNPAPPAAKPPAKATAPSQAKPPQPYAAWVQTVRMLEPILAGLTGREADDPPQWVILHGTGITAADAVMKNRQHPEIFQSPPLPAPPAKAAATTAKPPAAAVILSPQEAGMEAYTAAELERVYCYSEMIAGRAVRLVQNREGLDFAVIGTAKLDNGRKQNFLLLPACPIAEYTTGRPITWVERKNTTPAGRRPSLEGVIIKDDKGGEWVLADAQQGITITYTQSAVAAAAEKVGAA